MNTDLYIYVNTNVCYKINMFAYRVVETIKKYWHHESWGEKRIGNTMDSNRRHVTPRPPALPLSYRGKRVRSALSIVVVSVRSVLNITSGCFVLYTWTSKQNHHLASITQSPWVRWVIEQTYPSALVFWIISLLTFGGGVAEARLGWRVNNNIRRTNLTFWGVILKLTLSSFEGSKLSFLKWALPMFEREHSSLFGRSFHARHPQPGPSHSRRWNR